MLRSRSFFLKTLQLGGMFVAVTAACGGGCGSDSMSPEIPESLEITPSSLALRVGETGQFTAIVKGCDGRTLNESVDWSSSRPDVASVDVAGFVTGVTAGAATVTASVPGIGRNANVSVTSDPGAGSDPTASFASSCVGLTCQFTDQSSDADGAIEGWSWSFGDGASSVARSPSHTYSQAGTYTVGLTVTDDDGRTGSFSTSLAVSEPTATGSIVFLSDRSGVTKLYTMNANGSGVSPLMDRSLAFSPEPEWSPDGSHLVFNEGFDLYTVQANGAGSVKIAGGSAFLNDPTYAPDGQLIAFRTNSAVSVVGPDGSGRTEVGNVMNSGNAGGLAWMADGSMIWYSDMACAGLPPDRCGNLDNRLFGRSLVEAGLFIFPILETYKPDANHQEPAFSPNGRYLAFVCSYAGRRTINVLDFVSGDLSELTTHSESDWGPAWSPDSGSIVFVSDRDGNAEIYVMDPDGGNQRRLTNDPGSDTAPDWK